MCCGNLPHGIETESNGKLAQVTEHPPSEGQGVSDSWSQPAAACIQILHVDVTRDKLALEVLFQRLLEI